MLLFVHIYGKFQEKSLLLVLKHMFGSSLKLLCWIMHDFRQVRNSIANISKYCITKIKKGSNHATIWDSNRSRLSTILEASQLISRLAIFLQSLISELFNILSIIGAYEHLCTLHHPGQSVSENTQYFCGASFSRFHYTFRESIGLGVWNCRNIVPFLRI